MANIVLQFDDVLKKVEENDLSATISSSCETQDQLQTVSGTMNISTNTTITSTTTSNKNDKRSFIKPCYDNIVEKLEHDKHDCAFPGYDQTNELDVDDENLDWSSVADTSPS